MPTTSHTTFTIQQLVDKINGGNEMAPHDKISIKASTIFNRGDEETGVWSETMKKDYIESIMNGYPCGLISLVRDYGNAMNNYSSPWLILDGANKSRTLRDFTSNKFGIPHNGENKVLFENLPPTVQAKFMNCYLPISKTEVARTDPTKAISTMFTRLNTKQVALSQGELLKAFSWRKNHVIPELAKHIIHGEWDAHLQYGLHEDTPYECSDAITQNLEKIDLLRENWANSPMGVLCETKRLDNIALLCGMIITSNEKDIVFFDKRFARLETNLCSEVSIEQVSDILDDLLMFVDIMNVCYHKSVFGSATKGLPSRSKIIYVFGKIIEVSLSPESKSDWCQKLKVYFLAIQYNPQSLLKFKSICSGGGNNEVGSTKFNQVYNEINIFLEETYNISNEVTETINAEKTKEEEFHHINDAQLAGGIQASVDLNGGRS
jgi:hypothetical protein